MIKSTVDDIIDGGSAGGDIFINRYLPDNQRRARGQVLLRLRPLDKKDRISGPQPKSFVTMFRWYDREIRGRN